jgi:hypothetical protein
MLRSKTALSTLQKTYDESYLNCSTAVYYESQVISATYIPSFLHPLCSVLTLGSGQGNESEALRCWKSALDRIHDHNANRVLSTLNLRSETEKALLDSVRKLEFQCKERIDLLEALRISRQDGQAHGLDQPTINNENLGKRGGRASSETPDKRGGGWIGDGTIPAITYNQLSKPELPTRPVVTPRDSFDPYRRGSNLKSTPVNTDESRASSTPNFAAFPPTPDVASGDINDSRPSSPERHSMRTTLRSTKPGAKSTLSRRPMLSPVSDRPGASKAATLAWGTVGSLGRLGKDSLSPDVNPASEAISCSAPSPLQKSTWDSHSRRLVTSRRESGEGVVKDRQRPPDIGLQLESKPQSDQPSYFSVSAASSALSSSSQHEPATRSLRGDQLLERDASHFTIDSAGSRDEATPPSGLVLAKKEKAPHEKGIPRRKAVGREVGGGDATKLASRSSLENSHRPPLGAALQSSRVARSSSPSRLDGVPNYDPDSDPKRKGKGKVERKKAASAVADDDRYASDDLADGDGSKTVNSWRKRKAHVLANIPAGIDQHATEQILNEIVVQGDEVHWGDIAGLDIAKNALRETVVYPFLRPDLFKGLREPAKGMLLFGPPGTGKTMLARAVATESKSSFFSISASSLTSKYLGESEKLVRALFALARVLAPSIIFVDEIDSLLSQRSDQGEHEATRRIKTEFLIQWSNLQRAAAGRDAGDGDKGQGDANRVLVLAATNLPWAIDEAARRRFVRRQYIPLPEAQTRMVQINTLLGQQKHHLAEADIEKLVVLTKGMRGMTPMAPGFGPGALVKRGCRSTFGSTY